MPGACFIGPIGLLSALTSKFHPTRWDSTWRNKRHEIVDTRENNVGNSSGSVSHSVVSDSLWPHKLSPTSSSAHGILQARILDWLAISFSKGSSWCRDWSPVSCFAGRFFTAWAIRKSQNITFVSFISMLFFFFFNVGHLRMFWLKAIKFWTGLTFKFCYVFKAVSLCELSVSP